MAARKNHFLPLAVLKTTATTHNVHVLTSTVHVADINQYRNMRAHFL